MRRVNLSYSSTQTHFFSLFFSFLFYSSSLHFTYCTILYCYDTWQLSFDFYMMCCRFECDLWTIFVFSLISSIFDGFQTDWQIIELCSTYVLYIKVHTHTQTHTHTHRIYFLFSCLIVALHSILATTMACVQTHIKISIRIINAVPPSLPPSLLCKNFGIAK